MGGGRGGDTRRGGRGAQPQGTPAPPPPTQSAKPGVSSQQTVERQRNSPPSRASRLSKQGARVGITTTHGTTTQGTIGTGWGRITHNAGNHRAPSPSPPLRHTDENDGDDVVHNDVAVLLPVWLLVVPLLLCCSGLRHHMFIAFSS